MYDNALRINPNDADAYVNKGMRLYLSLRKCTNPIRKAWLGNNNVWQRSENES